MYIKTPFAQKNPRKDDISSAFCHQHQSSQTICCDCAFHLEVGDAIACIHPEQLDVNCATVTFCNCFQPAQEVDSPCVTFGNDDAE